ncbi:MAG: hypothetical protein FJW31_29815 [Acidobacteria bacterium]|nr:hypothetical protein [Acidobacteriota bacterium]
MLIPSSYALALAALCAAAFLWGAWANLQKASGKYRFEYFALYFSVGGLLGSLIAAVTLGSMGSDLTFEDNLVIAGRRNMATALAAGVLACIANYLTVAGVAVGGMAVAVPPTFPF